MAEHHSERTRFPHGTEQQAVLISETRQAVRIRVQRHPQGSAGGLERLMAEYEARIAALERLAGRQALELDSLREA